MPYAAPDKPRRSRITAACAVCRGKRQKCSGERPVCDQCRLHNEECWWSETKKRGPAKDYLRSLQDRLQETERLLLGVLGRVSDADLLNVLQSETSNIANAPSHQTWSSAMSGQEHWSQYPLNRLDTIRAWENGRHSYTPAVKSEQRSVYDPNLVPGSRSTSVQQELPSPTSAAPSASIATRASIPAIDHGDHFRNSSAIHAQEQSWPQAEHTGAGRSERRYSEETREAGEALFSISHHTRVAQQQQQHVMPQPQMHATSQAWSSSPGGEKAGSGTNRETLQTHFPKHLFW